MAGKTHEQLDESAGKLVGGLEKPEPDTADLAGSDASSYESYDSYDTGGSQSHGGSSGGDSTGSGSGDEAEPENDGAEDDASESDFAAEANSDDRGEDPGTDDEPQFETQPDEHETGNDGDGGDDSGNSGDGRVSMDIQAMTMLVAAMERARDQIPEYQAELRTILSNVELAEYVAMDGGNRLPDVVAWIEGELPGLRRRLALAQALEDGSFSAQPDRGAAGGRPPVVYHEDRVPGHPPHVSTENGRAAVSLFTTEPDSSQVSDIIAKLKGNQHDPYFAHELTNVADSETVAATVEAARARNDVDPARVDELTTLIAMTVRTARRGTGDLAPEEGFEEEWARFSSRT